MQLSQKIFFFNRAQIYILGQILSYFIVIFLSFIAFVFTFQTLRAIDLIILEGGSSQNILNLLLYLVILTFPIVLPTSLFFSLVFSYKNMGSENELIAFSSIGYTNRQLIMPAAVFSILIFYFSFICNTKLAPNSHIMSSVVENKIKATAIQSGLNPGSFVNFGDYTLYVTEKENNVFKKIFINNKAKNTHVFALSGKLNKYKDNDWNVNFILFNGKVFFDRDEQNSNTIKFGEYNISLPLTKNYKRVGTINLNQTNNQIKSILGNKTLSKNETIKYNLELVKRTQISFTVLVLALVALTTSFNVHQRNLKSNKMNLGILIGVGYWILFFIFDALAIKHKTTTFLYFPNLIYILLIIILLNKSRLFLQIGRLDRSNAKTI